MERKRPPKPSEAPGTHAVREVVAALEVALVERQALLRGPDSPGARADLEALGLLIGDYLTLLAGRVRPAAAARRPGSADEAAA